MQQNKASNTFKQQLLICTRRKKRITQKWVTVISLLLTDAGRKQLMRLIPPPCSFSDHYWNGQCHHYIFPVGYLKKSLLAFIYMLSNPSDTWANLTRILKFSRPRATLFTSNRTFSKYLDGTRLLSVAGRSLRPTDVITLQDFPCRFDIRPELLWSCLEKGKEGFRPLGRVSISLFAIINKMQMQTGYAPFSWKSYQLHRLFFLNFVFFFWVVMVVEIMALKKHWLTVWVFVLGQIVSCDKFCL